MTTVQHIEWTKQNAVYDTLIAIGDCTPAQQARLSIVLWSMVQCDLGDYLPADIAVYERNARKGQAYLARHNLPAFPDSREIADLNLIYERDHDGHKRSNEDRP